jgi:hypothetical protein
MTRHVACGILRVVSFLALLAAPVLAQDNDEDGTLPGSYDQTNTSPASSTPGAVGIVAPDLDDDVLDASEARLMATDLDGPTQLDIEALPSDAMFVTSGPVDLSATDAAVSLQGAGQLVLEPGFGVTLEAAPQALGRVTLLVLHAADADLHALLAGSVVPVALVAVGDVSSVDLVLLQDLVTKHAAGLTGLHVTVVDLSLDLQGHLRVAAARVTPEAGPIEFVTD